MKLALHGHNYKATALAGLDRHNRRINKNYGNDNIDKDRIKNNIIIVAPEENLYRDAKRRIDEQVIAYGGRVTKISNWITEFIAYAPENLTVEQIKDYFCTITDYFGEKIGKDNILSAVVHLDEVHAHIHLDFTPIIDHRLSSKKIMTRNFLIKLHDQIPQILSKKGYDVQRGDTVKPEERHLKGRSAEKYKSEIEAEKATVLRQCKTAQLVEKELKKNNLELAKKIILKEKDLKKDLSR